MLEKKGEELVENHWKIKLISMNNQKNCIRIQLYQENKYMMRVSKTV